MRLDQYNEMVQALAPDRSISRSAKLFCHDAIARASQAATTCRIDGNHRYSWIPRGPYSSCPIRIPALQARSSIVCWRPKNCRRQPGVLSWNILRKKEAACMATADCSAADLSPGSLPKRVTIACAHEVRCRSHSRLIPSRKRRTAFKADQRATYPRYRTVPRAFLLIG